MMSRQLVRLCITMWLFPISFDLNKCSVAYFAGDHYTTP